jgi:RNA polymerase sigma-54 factor
MCNNAGLNISLVFCKRPHRIVIDFGSHYHRGIIKASVEGIGNLQVPTAYLEERIKEEIEENPALEISAGEEDNWENADPVEQATEADDGVKEVDIEKDPFELDTWEVSDYADNDDVAEYKLKDDNYPEFDDKQAIPVRVETSFHEVQIDQLGILDITDEDRKIAEQ